MTARPHTEHSFASHDGAALFYRHWAPVAPGSAGAADAVDAVDAAGAVAGGPSAGTAPVPAPDASVRPRAVVLFHRGHEHGGRMMHVADELDLPDHHVFAWDARGLGRSPGERGYAEHFGVLVQDVDAFIRHISQDYGIAVEDIAVIAQSVGAVLVATWVHDYAPAIRCMVLASPAFDVKLYVPLARPGLALMQKARGKCYVNSYVKARYLTHDPERITSYMADPLITRPIAVNVLLGLYEAADRVVADAAAIHTPTQLLVSGADWVVRHQPQFDFLERLSAPIKESQVFPGFFHDTLGERDRHLPIAAARAFILRCEAAPPALRQARPALLAADREGPTRREFDALQLPPDSLAARAWWALGRLGIQAGAMLSAGMRLGVDTGFDSGSTLDYVYRDEPAGRGPLAWLGRLADKAYLQSIGWRGIRVRKANLLTLIHRAVDRLAAAGMPVRVVDIAAGHGRYVLEALAARKDAVQDILLRDYSPLNVAGGGRLIETLGLADIARFEQGDAFDQAGLAALAPAPTLAVVSGLYELFPGNDGVRASLAGLAGAMAPGTVLLYTNQPWHPQLEMIARTLTSHRADMPWIMRRRTQAEMDALVAAAGFRKIEQLGDPWGIFTVSMAVRDETA